MSLGVANGGSASWVFGTAVDQSASPGSAATRKFPRRPCSLQVEHEARELWGEPGEEVSSRPQVSYDGLAWALSI